MGVTVKNLFRLQELSQLGHFKSGGAIIELGAQELYCKGMEQSVANFLNNFASNQSLKPSISGTNHLSRHDEILLLGESADLREQFINGRLSHEKCLMFYHLVVKQHGCFPYDWEYEILLKGLELEPGRRDLIERLEFVKNQRVSS